MRFEVLGPLRAVSGEAEVDLGEPQQRKLLALLLAAPNTVVSTDRLIEEMWPNEAPMSARHLIHVYIARIRASLRAVDDRRRVVRSGAGYQLSVAEEEVDALGLASAVQQARLLHDEDPDAAAQRLRSATASWRGSPFDGFADESPMLRVEADRLDELRLGALEDLVTIEMELGRHFELVGPLEQLTAEHPFRERLWCQRMTALYRCGRQAEALQTYQLLRSMLAEELGVEPGSDAVVLERRILLQDPELLWEPPPPPSNVPSPVSSFIGRTWELEEITRLLDGSRLVTLTGPGGIGKTRLAIEAAEAVLSRFADGVWWVDLAEVRDAGLVAATLANALGVQPRPGARLEDSVISALVRRSALLVLDNCEHLRPTVAELVGETLRGTRRVRVLATSRSPLRTPGEVLWDVPPMAVPSMSAEEPTAPELADAVRLFVTRSIAVDTGFRFDDDPVAVEGICRRLDGLPLAIEMAAAQVRVLSPAQIVEALSDRFAMLASPGVESRYDTLEAALDWSFELLEPEHRRVFQRLTVFAGPFDLSAAEAVAGRGQAPILDTIKALVDASMLVPVRPASQATRYRLLETVRDYGMRRLHAGTEEQLARQAHAGHFLALVEEASDALDTGEFAAWVDRLRADYLDLREALGWWLEHQPRTRVLRLARTLFHLWMSTGDSREAGFWGERMLEGAQSEPSSIRAGGHHLVGFSANMRGDAEVAVAHADLSVDLYRSAGDRVGLATALFGSGNVALLMGEPERAAALAGEILTICDETGGRWSRAGALSILAFVHWARGSLDEARRHSEEAAAIYGELGDIAGQVVMCPVGAIALEQGELRVAESYANQAVVVAIGTAWEGAALVLVAQVLLARGEEDAAEPVARLGMTRALDAGVELWFRRALLALARVHAARGSAELAATLLGASGRNAFGTELDAGPIAFVENRCRSKLGDREFELARDRGRGLSHAQLLDLVPPPGPAEAASSVPGGEGP